MFEGAITFNNGDWPVTVFWGLLNENEFRDFHTSTFFGPFIRRPNPRQTMNWEVGQVVNFNFMFNNASSFVNVDIGAWFVAVHIARNILSFRGGNCPMSELFLPINIFLYTPNRGR